VPSRCRPARFRRCSDFNVEGKLRRWSALLATGSKPGLPVAASAALRWIKTG
jgi:hypothetical protein